MRVEVRSKQQVHETSSHHGLRSGPPSLILHSVGRFMITSERNDLILLIQIIQGVNFNFMKPEDVSDSVTYLVSLLSNYGP